jgi:hypothetical protein
MAHRAKALAKMQAPWVLEATAVMQQSADNRLLMVQTFIYSAVMYAEVGHDEGVKDKMSAVVKKALAAF